MKNIIKVTLISGLLLGSTQAFAGSCGSCGSCPSKAKNLTQSVQNTDIVTTAMASGKFQTLVTAVAAADLVETLQGEGPYTVFAPTDEAFAKLPAGTVESLLKPENKDKLAAILTYHVVPGKVMAADVQTGKVATANGASASVEVSESGVTIDGANVVATDIVTGNGVIHVIDTVILPPESTQG
ncbi:MAG: fasciclin domain-containing protein [Verrucomicrobiota bacterium]